MSDDADPRIKITPDTKVSELTDWIMANMETGADFEFVVHCSKNGKLAHLALVARVVSVS